MMPEPRFAASTLLFCCFLLAAHGADDNSGLRRTIELDSHWQFAPGRVDERKQWKALNRLTEWEQHEGVDFNGVGRYRKVVEPIDLPLGRRLFLEFDGVATHATVFWNGQRLGSHLGAWTSFRFELTELVRKARKDATHELLVVVDELVGHNTQGFLPVILPHFGGIWRPVRLVDVGSSFIDQNSVRIVADVDRRAIQFNAVVDRSPDDRDLVLNLRAEGSAPRTPSRVVTARVQHNGQVHCELPIEQPKLWDIGKPNLYEAVFELAKSGKDAPTVLERYETRIAFRRFEAVGKEFRLNGRPISIRGVLNWGYYPPHLAPDVSDERFRNDLKFIRSYGFNLMKFCLWMPQPRLLRICDEEGVLAWIEYPAWHPKFEPKYRAGLLREYAEFLDVDRNHPSVILRSLTCETGPSADLSVVRSLYDLAKQKCPGAVVEDDSSWIGWNRIHDFYDDHPYGNNNTWVDTLAKLKSHIAVHGEKPLALGEAIAADTWTPPQQPLQKRISPPSQLPGSTFRSWSHPADRNWLAAFQRRDRTVEPRQPITDDLLENDSKRYALLMRKYQIETYRREVPAGAYVVSVIRDFPLAPMGLIDYREEAKWPQEHWAWHGDDMLLLATANDRRSFVGGETAEIRWLAARSTRLETLSVEKRTFDQVNRPQCVELVPDRVHSKGLAPNSWPVWITPPLDQQMVRLLAARHPSLRDQTSLELLAGVPEFAAIQKQRIPVAARLDRNLLEFIEAGGKAILLPDGQTNSFPLRSHWFLRGGPVIGEHPLAKLIGRDLLVELQHFDLSGDVVPDIGYLDEIDPVAMLWDRHDIKTVKTHGLVFETNIGKGRLLVSALNHLGSSNAAGKWAFQNMLLYLNSASHVPQSMKPETLLRLKQKLEEMKIDLTPRSWQFRPDPKAVGVAAGWALPTVPDGKEWKPIRVGAHWEGQGYPNLDGWAWYRIEIDVPANWKGKPAYLSLDGADDYYEVFANGILVGTGGDRATKTTAFDERKSHSVAEAIIPGQRCTIAIRVFDWYGAGGLHRPVWLSTAPVCDRVDWMR